MSVKIANDQMIELISAFSSVQDPRVQGRCKHKLIDILVLTVLGVLCGAEGISEIEEFGHQKMDFLERYIDLSKGVPSHDTIARVLSIISPETFELAFAGWVAESLHHPEKGKSIALDGKSVRGTERRFEGKYKALHIVSAYCHHSGLTLCQSESRSSGMAEKAAALECLQLLDIKDATVTVDAGLNSKDIIRYIRSCDGHYVAPIKKNHRNCLEQVENIFTKRRGKKTTLEEKEHGRKDTRSAEVLSPSKLDSKFHDSFPDAKTAICIERTRITKDNRTIVQKTGDDGKQYYERNTGTERTKTSKVFYVSSLELTPTEALDLVRQHWGIENKLHWLLDVSFKEDAWNVRAKKAARSLTVARKIALNLIRNSSTKGSVRARMKRAAWNNDFLEQLLVHA